MPELPEVHTITSILNKEISGHKILKVLVAKDYITQPSVDIFLHGTHGRRILSVERVAKNIIMSLDNGTFIIFHLAMTGRLLLNKDNESFVKVIFNLENNGQTKKLTFSDMRMFGKVVLTNSKQLDVLKNKYGPEPIKKDLTPKEFEQAIKSKKTSIKNALLDQHIVSGLGNIYVTDALFLAGINPKTSTKDITEKDAEKLLEAAKKVLNDGIRHRGSTLDDKMYVDPFGNEGEHQKYFEIYSKTKCPKCGSKVEFTKINGRGTYFCPNCQPLK